MSARSTVDKSEVDDFYKSAIENQNRSKSKTSSTVYTHPLLLDLSNLPINLP